MANRTWFCSALAAGILFYQLFSPGFVGLADNGDFPRLAGHYSLCPVDGWDADRFLHFIPTYVERPSCYWESEVPTSALLFARAARAAAPGPVFPIRALAAGYAFILIALVAFWPPLILFCDLSNTAYFNSFYLDAAALLGLLATALCARRVLTVKTNLAIACYTGAALFLTTTKLQHATLAIPLAVYLAAQVRWRATLPAALLLASAAFMSYRTPAVYKITNLWNSVFVGLVPNSPTALADLHLSPDYAPYNNRNAYVFPNPAAAEHWETRLSREMSYSKLARYYIEHPILACSRIVASARGMQHLRPDYLGNTQPGTPPNTQSHRADFFSTAKTYLFQRVPYLMLAVYAACGFLIPRPLALLFLAIGGTEFLTSTFADSVLDYRHHALLHQLADLWLLCALFRNHRDGAFQHLVAAGRNALARSRDRNRRMNPHPMML